MRLQIKAFTLLETLLTLWIVTFIYLALSASMRTSFRQVEETVFFSEFEHLYQETQEMALSQQVPLDLRVGSREVVTPFQTLTIPSGIRVQDPKSIQFDRAGGNSSLAKLQFETERGVVTYQLSLGNGKYKKKISSR